MTGGAPRGIVVGGMVHRPLGKTTGSGRAGMAGLAPNPSRDCYVICGQAQDNSGNGRAHIGAVAIGSAVASGAPGRNSCMAHCRVRRCKAANRADADGGSGVARFAWSRRRDVIDRRCRLPQYNGGNGRADIGTVVASGTSGRYAHMVHRRVGRCKAACGGVGSRVARFAHGRTRNVVRRFKCRGIGHGALE